mmetsp:Transcript_95283/g.164437  ORF Transcript_95283/g.164437 Transcript_95283/m.164437 type:complete len:95 (-) Transcript_95283:700-984(-)
MNSPGSFRRFRGPESPHPLPPTNGYWHICTLAECKTLVMCTVHQQKRTVFAFSRKHSLAQTPLLPLHRATSSGYLLVGHTRTTTFLFGRRTHAY